MPTGDEHPDPDAPPSETAPGEPGVTEQRHGGGQFGEAYRADPEQAAVGAVPVEDDDADDREEPAEPPATS